MTAQTNGPASARCSIDGCEKPVRARDLCATHYSRLRRHGDAGGAELRGPKPLQPCSVTGCESLTRSSGAEYCEKHYGRMRRTGTLETLVRPPGSGGGPCSVEGCNGIDKNKGMCEMHATRVKRHGDPHAFTHQRDRSLPRGEANNFWTGNNASYVAVHQRLRSSRGSASTYACIDCGGRAWQWSYDHADPDERESPVGTYSVKSEHYVPRCTPCHKKFDLSLKPKVAESQEIINAIARMNSEGVALKLAARRLGISTKRVRAVLDSLGLPGVRTGLGGGTEQVQVIAANVRRMRDERGWSRKKLATVAGVASASIFKIEMVRSPGSPKTRALLAAAFGVEVSELLAAPCRTWLLPNGEATLDDPREGATA